MKELEIKDEELAKLEGAVVVVTGCSTGIGLATTKLLLDLKAKVVGAARHPGELSHPNFSYFKTDVTSWPSLLALFQHAENLHGHIDHVFSNAGTALGQNDYLSEQHDENGELLAPNTTVLDVNLKGLINTSYLGLTYMRRANPAKGSIVCCSSVAGFKRFRGTDYTTSKHAILGWMRGIVPNLIDSGLAIRVNSVCPSWTLDAMVPEVFVPKMDAIWQDPGVVAKSVALLMADESRQGQIIYSSGGRFAEIEEQVFIPAAWEVGGEEDHDKAAAQMWAAISEITAAQAKGWTAPVSSNGGSVST